MYLGNALCVRAMSDAFGQCLMYSGNVSWRQMNATQCFPNTQFNFFDFALKIP